MAQRLQAFHLDKSNSKQELPIISLSNCFAYKSTQNNLSRKYNERIPTSIPVFDVFNAGHRDILMNWD